MTSAETFGLSMGTTAAMANGFARRTVLVKITHGSILSAGGRRVFAGGPLILTFAKIDR
jgi:hypothetical protein